MPLKPQKQSDLYSENPNRPSTTPVLTGHVNTPSLHKKLLLEIGGVFVFAPGCRAISSDPKKLFLGIQLNGLPYKFFQFCLIDFLALRKVNGPSCLAVKASVE